MTKYELILIFLALCALLYSWYERKKDRRQFDRTADYMSRGHRGNLP